MSDCVAVSEWSDGHLALTDSERADVLLETFRCIIRLLDVAAVNLEFAETAQIPKTSEPFAVVKQAVTNLGSIIGFKSADPDKSPGWWDALHPLPHSSAIPYLDRRSNWIMENCYNSVSMQGGGRHKPETYSPVSPTRTLCICREITRNGICKHPVDHTAISAAQHVFMIGTSYPTIFFFFPDQKTRLLGECHRVKVCYIDLSKALDPANHDHLDHKMKPFGLTGMANR